METIIVGSGKLATELLSKLGDGGHRRVVAWADKDRVSGNAVVVHAGSGRELGDVIAYCTRTQSPLVELATGSAIEEARPAFPVVLCPNTNILMLKFMHMLAQSGPMFSGYRIRLTESHQAQKRSVPGTAVAMAQALGLAAGDVRSVRDREAQQAALRIPEEHLGRHAYHQIVIEDAVCTITMETRVYGASPYADGVSAIVAAIGAHALENRLYTVDEFVGNGWL